MAVRTPLYWDGTGIAPMTAAMVTDCVDEMIRQHGLNPAVTLSYVASSGSLTGMDDTRLTSGASATSSSVDSDSLISSFADSSAASPDSASLAVVVSISFDSVSIVSKASVSLASDSSSVDSVSGLGVSVFLEAFFHG